MIKFIIILLVGLMLVGCIHSDNKLVLKSENTLPRIFSLNSTVRLPGGADAGPLDFKWDGEKYVATKEGQKVKALWLGADHGVKFAQLQIQGEEGYWFAVLDDVSGGFRFSVRDAMGLKFSKAQEKLLEKWRVDGVDQKKRAATISFEKIKSSLLFVYVKEKFQIPLLVGADLNTDEEGKFMQQLGTVEVVPGACEQCTNEVRRVVGRWKDYEGSEELRLFEDGIFVGLDKRSWSQGTWHSLGGGKYLVKYKSSGGVQLKNDVILTFRVNDGRLEFSSPDGARAGVFGIIK